MEQNSENTLADLYWKILASLKYEEAKVNVLKDIANFNFPTDKEEFNQFFKNAKGAAGKAYETLTKNFTNVFVYRMEGDGSHIDNLSNYEKKIEDFLKGVYLLIECYLEK